MPLLPALLCLVFLILWGMLAPAHATPDPPDDGWAMYANDKGEVWGTRVTPPSIRRFAPLSDVERVPGVDWGTMGDVQFRSTRHFDWLIFRTNASTGGVLYRPRRAGAPTAAPWRPLTDRRGVPYTLGGSLLSCAVTSSRIMVAYNSVVLHGSYILAIDEQGSGGTGTPRANSWAYVDMPAFTQDGALLFFDQDGRLLRLGPHAASPVVALNRRSLALLQPRVLGQTRDGYVVSGWVEADRGTEIDPYPEERRHAWLIRPNGSRTLVTPSGYAFLNSSRKGAYWWIDDRYVWWAKRRREREGSGKWFCSLARWDARGGEQVAPSCFPLTDYCVLLPCSSGMLLLAWDREGRQTWYAVFEQKRGRLTRTHSGTLPALPGYSWTIAVSSGDTLWMPTREGSLIRCEPRSGRLSVIAEPWWRRL